MATEWVFKLRDQISGPAQDIQQQLTRVTAALRQLDIQTKQARLEKTLDPLKKQRLELQLQRDKLLQSKRAVDEHARATTSASRSWMDSLLKWAGSLYILDTVRRAFSAVGRAALEMGSQVKDAIETRQRGLFGLRATMGNAAGGNFFGQLERQAQAYGRPPGEIVGMGASFAELGASPNIARALVAAVSDVRARTGGRVNIAEQIRSILTSPVLGVGNVEAFAGAFPLKNLWASIGQWMKMRPGDAEQMFRLNQVRGGAGSPLIASLLDTVADLPGQGGRIGTMAQKFGGTTLEGSIGRVQTAWESFLASIENSRGIRTLQQVLQNLATTLGGGDMRGSLRSLADTLDEALKPLTGAEGRKRMEDFFKSLTAIIEGMLPLLAKAAHYV